MEFLIAALVIAVGVYIGYKYYQAKRALPEPYVLPESAVINVEPLPVTKVEVGTVSLAEAEKKVDAVKEKVKKAPKATTKTTKTEEPAKKATAKKTPAKKKPNIKVAD